MEVIEQPLQGVVLFRPRVFEDARGTFFESASPKILGNLEGAGSIVQLNVSRSRAGALRGLHYQLAPLAQGKLIRVSRGAIFDVVVDVRQGSSTFGKWASFELDEDEPRHLWVPRGFAHGFCALADRTEIYYGVTSVYSPTHERTLLWCDPQLAIPWPEPDGGFLLSDKDRAGVPLSRLEAVTLDRS